MTNRGLLRFGKTVFWGVHQNRFSKKSSGANFWRAEAMRRLSPPPCQNENPEGEDYTSSATVCRGPPSKPVKCSPSNSGPSPGPASRQMLTLSEAPQSLTHSRLHTHSGKPTSRVVALPHRTRPSAAVRLAMISERVCNGSRPWLLAFLGLVFCKKVLGLVFCKKVGSGDEDR